MDFWPHNCIITPYTRYEQKAVLRVREPRQTVMVHPFEGKFNVDTCKWDSDSIPSLNAGVSYDDLIRGFSPQNTYPSIPNDDLCFDEHLGLISISKCYKPRDTLAEQEAEELRMKQRNHAMYLAREKERLEWLKIEEQLKRQRWAVKTTTPVYKPNQNDPGIEKRLEEAALKKRQGQGW